MALEPESERVSFMVDVFDLAVVKEAKRNVLRRFEYHVVRFAGDFLEIDVKSLYVLFQEEIILIF